MKFISFIGETNFFTSFVFDINNFSYNLYTDLNDLLELINDKKTRTISDIESSIIDQLNGGCTTPIGCLVNLNNDEYIINIFLSNKSGTKQIVKQFKFKSKSISDLTSEVVSKLYSLGAKEIVKEYTN